MIPTEIRSDLLALVESLRVRVDVSQKLIALRRDQLRAEYGFPDNEHADEITEMLSSELSHYVSAYSSAIQALAATGYFKEPK